MPYHNFHLPYNTKTCITVWKVETTAKGNFVNAYLSNQQGNSDFEFIAVSVSTVTVIYIRYQYTVSLKSYTLKIESFCFLLLAVSTKKKTY